MTMMDLYIMVANDNRYLIITIKDKFQDKRVTPQLMLEQ